MGFRRVFAFGSLMISLVMMIDAGSASAFEQNPTFPAYGSGPVEVRLYTDYFCPPCRVMEPEVEPLLKDLLKKNAIHLTLVDAPFNPLSPLFARNFLYAIKQSNALEEALKARNVLQNAATNKEIKTQEQIAALFKEKGIAFSRVMEPVVEPILKELLKKNAIRLILVDVPFSQLTPLFARNFLYALKWNNELEHAFRVRNVLLEASTRKDVTTQERIEALFREKGIPSSAFDAKPVFDRYNALIKEDKINTTPTCVVIKNDQKKAFVGGADIVNALKVLP